MPLLKVALYLVVGVAISAVEAGINCLGGPAFGLEAACDFQNFAGLNGHPASEILYQILMQSPLDNNTFFRNESHVSCLFRDTSFILNGFGGGVGPASFTLGGITVPGTLCVFATDVEAGGLYLGEIRQLASVLIDQDGGDCDKCGRISVNEIDKNESRKGYLKFNWDDNASCLGDCIDPARDIQPTPTATPTPSPSSLAMKRFMGSTAMSWTFLMLWAGLLL